VKLLTEAEDHQAQVQDQTQVQVLILEDQAQAQDLAEEDQDLDLAEVVPDQVLVITAAPDVVPTLETELQEEVLLL